MTIMDITCLPLCLWLTETLIVSLRLIMSNSVCFWIHTVYTNVLELQGVIFLQLTTEERYAATASVNHFGINFMFREWLASRAPSNTCSLTSLPLLFFSATPISLYLLFISHLASSYTSWMTIRKLWSHKRRERFLSTVSLIFLHAPIL